MSTQSTARKYTERWTKIESLGEHGQGVAIKATDQDGAIAFVKVLREQHRSERRVRMYREISALRTLRSPGIPRLIESNADNYADKSYDLFIATEFIEGRDLERAVIGDEISSTVAVKLTIALSQILKEAHTRGIHHRDIKPDNIIVRLLESGPVPVLVDFGMASLQDSDDDFMTNTGQEIGNRFLRLPELSSGSEDKRDARSDLTFCVGLLFYMLTKQRPYILVDKNDRFPHQRGDARAVFDASGLDTSKLANLFDKGFQRSIDRRFQSIDEFAEELERLLSSRSISAVKPIKLRDLVDRLGSATEVVKADHREKMSRLMTTLGSVVIETSDLSKGLFQWSQTGWNQAEHSITSIYGLQFGTNKEQKFDAHFYICVNGGEFVIRLDGRGMRRMRMWIPLESTLSPEDRTAIQDFLTTGLDRATDPIKRAEDRVLFETLKAKAMEFASAMMEKTFIVVTTFASQADSGIIDVKTTQFAARLSGDEASIIGQAFVGGRVAGRENYVRINLGVGMSVPNHLDDVNEMQASQDVTLTLMKQETGSGPSIALRHSATFGQPFIPSQSLLGKALTDLLDQV